MTGSRFAGSAFGDLANGILNISGLKGDPGQDASTPSDGTDGKDSAMQKITVGNQSFTSDILSEVIFPGGGRES